MKKFMLKKTTSVATAVSLGISPCVNVYAETSENGQELVSMMDQYGSNYIDDNLDTNTQLLIILATMTSLQAYSQIEEQIYTALDLGITPEEIKEAVYQAAPYCGYTKALSAMESVDKSAVSPLRNIFHSDKPQKFEIRGIKRDLRFQIYL